MPNLSSRDAARVDMGSFDPLTLRRSAGALMASLRQSRRNTMVAVTSAPRSVQNLIGRVENDRAHPVEHVVTLLYDAHRRGAPRPDVEAFPLALHAFVVEMYDRGASVPDVRTLIRAETESGAAAKCAEMEVLIAPSPKAFADAREAVDGHLNELRALADALRRIEFSEARVA